MSVVVAKASSSAKSADRGSATLATHRRARYDYEILQSYDAGLALLGSEVKSIRAGHSTLSEGYCRFRDNELWLYGVNIAPYAPARENHEPARPRKLLLHRRELERLREAMEQEPRTTVIPLRLHLSHGVQAMFHSLGLKSPNWAPAIDVFSRVLAMAIFAGYASIPLAVMTGIVR